ncbi:hypothetical protein [Streptomyces sp. NPDC002589]|uniref:hypothetical protein n=1 Tax=Streptomyces sp. NPDC002589 TaxID=3154420 RepID=UPI0033199B01
MSKTIRLELIGLPDSDEEEMLRLSGQLRHALLELDVADARHAPSSADTPAGAKSGELISFGALVVTATPWVVSQVVKLADSWLKNRPVRGIKVELDGLVLELTDASAVERERLIDAFLARLAQPADAAEDTEEPQMPAS